MQVNNEEDSTASFKDFKDTSFLSNKTTTFVFLYRLM